MKNYYHELPLGYKKIKVIDAKNRKTILLFNLAAILMLALAVVSFLLFKPVALPIKLSLPF
ncbi:MAG TPA: hypothetical protein PLQ99_05460, partial [Bacilli bacterium]|nr:hypothetical protein [Bacilli bacterium]